jgi:hypothetical protein
MRVRPSEATWVKREQPSVGRETLPRCGLAVFNDGGQSPGKSARVLCLDLFEVEDAAGLDRVYTS